MEEFERWLKERYASYVFHYHATGLGIHRRLMEEAKDVLEKFEEIERIESTDNPPTTDANLTKGNQ